MVKHWTCIAIIGLAAGCAHSHMDHHGDEENEKGETAVSIDEIPAPARQTLMQEAHGANLTDLEREEKHGKTVYEAHAMVDGNNMEFHVRADGKLLQKEIEKKEEDND